MNTFCSGNWMEMCQVIALAGCFDSLSEGTEGEAAVNEASRPTPFPEQRQLRRGLWVFSGPLLSSSCKCIPPRWNAFARHRGLSSVFHKAWHEEWENLKIKTKRNTPPPSLCLYSTVRKKERCIIDEPIMCLSWQMTFWKLKQEAVKMHWTVIWTVECSGCTQHLYEMYIWVFHWKTNNTRCNCWHVFMTEHDGFSYSSVMVNYNFFTPSSFSSYFFCLHLDHFNCKWVKNVHPIDWICFWIHIPNLYEIIYLIILVLVIISSQKTGRPSLYTLILIYLA